MVGVHSNVPTSEPQERTPVEEDFTSQFAALSAETVRLVVEARVAVMFVVDAYEATVDTPLKERKALDVRAPSVVANGTRPERSVERVKLVVDAVVAVSAVVDAYGMVDGLVPVAVSTPTLECPTELEAATSVCTLMIGVVVEFVVSPWKVPGVQAKVAKFASLVKSRSVMSARLRSSSCTAAQVALYAAERTRTNWFVHVWVLAAPTTPVEFARRTAFGIPETVRLVVEAVPEYAVSETVENVEDAYVTNVELAMSEYGAVPLNQIGVLVALTSVPE